MLVHLKIQNYALIKHLEVSLDASLNIITGETGAGKSIILGAIGLLKGERADTKALLNEEEKCIIEAEFTVSNLQLESVFEENDIPYFADCLIRREIAPTGRSRAFINDSPVTLDVLQLVSTSLLDVHSQNDNLLLENSNYQLEFIDAFAQNSTLKTAYYKEYKTYVSLKKQLEDLERESTANSKNNDYEAFILKELQAAQIKPNEDEILKQEIAILNHAEEIKSKLNVCISQFNESQFGLLSNLKSSINALEKIALLDTNLELLKSRMVSCYEELKDINSELETKEHKTEFDHDNAEKLRQRLDLIYNLQAKHKVQSANELIQLIQQLESKLGNYFNLDEQLDTLKKEFKNSEDILLKIGSDLSESRLKHTPELCNLLMNLLKNISINNAEVVIEHQKTLPTKSGIDQFEILFSANKGIKVQKLKNVASGGEFSRLLLCIKYILASKKALPTLIFDEIDTGVSGDVALKMAQMMQSMSKNHQIITITHLPQIAAFGKKHFYVYKDDTGNKTSSNMRELDHNKRIEHIAEMIGGKNPSPLALANAKELLENYTSLIN